jgi:hypothetical protein
MRKKPFLTLGTSALFGLIATLTVQSSPASAANGNRLQASFNERTAQVTNALAQFGVLQIINTGTGTVQGFGPATMVLSITQDHDVTPCGPGSSTNAAIRRITLAQGVLVEEELAIACPTPSGGLIITGTYQVDGRSSTGLFAGARGEGTLTAETTVNPPTSTLSGKLFLARPLG